MAEIVDYLHTVKRLGGSDLHLSVGVPPSIRINGQVQPLQEAPLTAERSRELISGVLTDRQRATLEEHLELDFAFNIEELGRFRGNAHFNRSAMEATFRHISDHVPTLKELGHLPVVEELCNLQSGLVLVTGVTGSGKSTTLSSMVNHIAKSRNGVIISIEDPIEFILEHKNCIVKQREIGQDTLSFASALKHALRQDPDVLLVSELRDLETMQAALTAAETGHLVLSTLHTIDAPKALDRMIDAFPAEQQGQVTAQLANALKAVVSQRLLPKLSGEGRVLITEIMKMNPAIQNCVRKQKFEQIPSLMEIGAADGMQTIDEALIYQVGIEAIHAGDALAHCRDETQIKSFLELSPRKRNARLGLPN